MPRRKVASTLSAGVPLLLALSLVAPAASAKWKYFRAGNAADSTVTPRPGFALMGGGEQDPALRFLCERANGGEFLILSANTEDDYAQKVNEEMRAMCPLNSAATIVFSEREDSDDPKLIERIVHAQAIFIAGGDQSNYVRFWQDTPVEDAINHHIAAGKPIGGSSAGLAVLGEFSFSSMIDTIHSTDALADPYGNKVTISRDFLRIPLLAGIITDTHFSKRDRMGRLLVFMARILEDGWAKQVRAIAVEEGAAVLLEPDGQAKIIGSGPAYFLEAKSSPEVCQRKSPLSISGITVHRAPSGASFNVKDWKGTGGDDYQISAVKGEIKALGSSHGIY
jgi:cyanophycinase